MSARGRPNEYLHESPDFRVISWKLANQKKEKRNTPTTPTQTEIHRLKKEQVKKLWIFTDVGDLVATCQRIPNEDTAVTATVLSAVRTAETKAIKTIPKKIYSLVMALVRKTSLHQNTGIRLSHSVGLFVFLVAFEDFVCLFRI